MNGDPMIIEIPKGTHIDTASERLVQAARTSGRTVEAVFNGTRLVATPESTADEIYRYYGDQCRQGPAFLCDLRDTRVTTLFVAVIIGHQSDPVARVFSDKSTAIAWARKNFLESLAHPKGYIEYGPDGNRPWSAFYEYESDYAWINAVELDDGSDA